MLLDSSKFSHDYILCLREFFGNNKIEKEKKTNPSSNNYFEKNTAKSYPIEAQKTDDTR
jgi:hypothetical protein